MFVTERFLSDDVEKYGENPVSTVCGTWYPIKPALPKAKSSSLFFL